MLLHCWFGPRNLRSHKILPPFSVICLDFGYLLAPAVNPCKRESSHSTATLCFGGRLIKMNISQIKTYSLCVFWKLFTLRCFEYFVNSLVRCLAFYSWCSIINISVIMLFTKFFATLLFLYFCVSLFVHFKIFVILFTVTFKDCNPGSRPHFQPWNPGFEHPSILGFWDWKTCQELPNWLRKVIWIIVIYSNNYSFFTS